MKTFYRIATVYSDGSGSYATYENELEAIDKSIALELELPKGARIELTVITFSEPTIIYTAK